MSFQYITNISGIKNAVLVPFNDWEKIQEDLDELTRLRDKKAFFEGLKDAFKEVKLIKEGKKKPNSFDELLNEL